MFVFRVHSAYAAVENFAAMYCIAFRISLKIPRAEL